jgi:hypothetical protein
MNPLRAAYVKAVLALSDLPSFVLEAGRDGELLKIIIATGGPAMAMRDAIEEWFLPIMIAASKGSGSWPIFRGVDEEALARALANGIDVVPSDHHWYGAELDKALEYGGDHPSVLIIDGARVARTWRELRLDAPTAEHEEASRFAAGEPMISEDGIWVLYSRLPAEDRGRGTAYEKDYAYYIPGDARDALIGYIQCVPAGGGEP